MHVHPKARRAGVVVSEAGSVTVRVCSTPEKGKANAAVIKIIADVLGIPTSALEIVQGHIIRNKRLLVNGTTQDEAFRRLQEHT